MSKKEFEIQISRAETDIWKLVKDILKIVDGEEGTLRVITIDSKDSYVVLKIVTLPKHKEEKGGSTAENAGGNTPRPEPYNNTD